MFSILRTDPRVGALVLRSLRTYPRRVPAGIPGGQQGSVSPWAANVPELRCFRSFAPLQGTVPFNLSDIGEGIKEVTIKEWFVKPGDKVKQFDEICEVTSDKASVTISSRYDGVIKKLHYAVDDIAQTGDPLVDIEVESEEQVEGEREIMDSEAQSAVEPSPFGSEERPEGRKLATPAVRRMAAENNVNLMDVVGSGKGGRILKDDIVAFLERGLDNEPAAKTTVAPPAAIKKPPHSEVPPKVAVSRPPPTPGKDEVKPMSPYVKAMVKAMSESLTIPHFVYSDEIHVDKLKEVKAALKESAAQSGVKLSYMPFILKAASLALASYPILNAGPDYEREVLLFRENHNIGIAMDTPNGLLVPNVKSVQGLSVLEIGAELNRLQELGVKGKLSSGDLSGGSFTISNIGSIGGTYMVPVITSGQVAIGAVGSILNRPVFDAEDKLVKASIMNVSWSADHRVIDGATVARFSNLMKEYIQSPEKMLLHLK